MPVPAKRQSSSKGRRRRAAKIIVAKIKTSPCPKCSSAVLAHHACPVCGTYKNREILKSKIDKKEMKKLAKKQKKAKAGEENR